MFCLLSACVWGEGGEVDQSSEHLQVGDQRVHLGQLGLAVKVGDSGTRVALQKAVIVAIGIGLHFKVELCLLDLFVRVGDAHKAVRREQVLEMLCVDLGFGEEGIFRHDAFGHNRLRFHQVVDVPRIRVATAHPCQIGTCAF